MPLPRLAAGVAALAVAGGLALTAVALSDPPPPRLPATESVPTSGARDVREVTPVSPLPTASTARFARDPGTNDASIPVPVSGAQVPPRERPVEIRIPAIGVDSRLVDLGIGKDGTMQVPTNPSRAGWLTAAPAPGQRGPAVIAGHVDTHEGPAVFHRLRDLRPGDAVDVVRRDGTVVSFTVRSLEHYAKDRFPTARVYGPAPGPVLRLITCSGEIDPVSGHYTDNTVVFAS